MFPFSELLYHEKDLLISLFSFRNSGIQIWRVKQFHLEPVPPNHYGEFFSGDSYIVLQTRKTSSSTFAWDIFFWLGAFTTVDEAGTAAYKAVELDTLLGGAPVQHREVQGHESETFLALFLPYGGLRILEGGTYILAPLFLTLSHSLITLSLCHFHVLF